MTLWQAFLACFVANANKVYFIVQCQEVKNNWKWFISNRFQGCPSSHPHLCSYCFFLFAVRESGTRNALLGP